MSRLADCFLLGLIGLVLVVVQAQDNPDSQFDSDVQKLRPLLNVYSPVSPNYPAEFFLVAGVVIALTFGIVFIVVGLLTMDPGKDSIIYRMTTTRMKKD